MHIHILGICGTFMGSLAQLAKASGHRVTGSDANVYPPMSTQLEAAGIELVEGFGPKQLCLQPDVVVVGNVVSRGNPVMEEILNRGLSYISGPQWLAENVLRGRWVIAVSGTHGKTTTSAMIAWILQYAGMSPGYLIGGVPGNFEVSACLGDTDFFVIEADEYDTAFFDKRSKFVHYQPRTLVINNLEFDHADIFENLAAIQTQFHHLVRVVPQQGLIICPDDPPIKDVLSRGCWSDVQTIGGGGWSYSSDSQDGSEFAAVFHDEEVGTVDWQLMGKHNIHNAVSAIAAARHVGVSPKVACAALCQFRGVKRRMELLGSVGMCRVYDDFAHHPSAIASTLDGLRSSVGGEEHIIVIIEPRSNTMKQGVHREELLESVQLANEVYWFQSHELEWSLRAHVEYQADSAGIWLLQSSRVFASTKDIIDSVVARPNIQPTHIVVMSNGGFENIHQRLLVALRQKV